MGHPNGPHRGGADRVKLALRDALKIYLWQHMSAHPGTWFSAVELARVISTEYIGARPRSLAGTERWGRSNIIARYLGEMAEDGEVEWRPRAGATVRGAREWRWAA